MQINFQKPGGGIAFLIAEYAKFEGRAIIRFLKAEGVNKIETHRIFQGVYVFMGRTF